MSALLESFAVLSSSPSFASSKLLNRSYRSSFTSADRRASTISAKYFCTNIHVLLSKREFHTEQTASYLQFSIRTQEGTHSVGAYA